MTRIFLATILLLTLAVPPAARPTNCKPFGRYPKYVCLCGKVALPMWVCEVVKR